MRVTISHQHFDGNFPDGFNNGAWIDLLRTEYADIVHNVYPAATVTVVIDRQAATGARTPVTVDADGSGSLPSSLVAAIECAEDELFNAHGSDDRFYTTENN